MVDELFSVSPISSSLEGMSLLGESSSWWSEFEWPKEVVGFFEMRSNGVDFVDQIFDAGDTELAQNLFNDSVVSKGGSLLVNFTISSFIYKFSDGFSGRITKSDVGLNSSQKVGWGFVHSHEGSVVELSQSQDSQDSDGSWVHFDDTSDSDHEG